MNPIKAPLESHSNNNLNWRIHQLPLFIWPLLLLLGLWLLPTPAGLSSQTWHLFSIFLSTIIALVLNPLPMGAVCFIALALLGLSGTLQVQPLLATFSSPIIWLILVAFLLARGFIKTGLGSRIAYYFMHWMGQSSIGLAYGLITTEVLLAPFTPSNTARGGGIVYPIVQALSQKYQSTPEGGSALKIGAYLMKIAYQTNVITSAMFLTAMAANPLIASLAKAFDFEISWKLWAIAALVPGLINLALLPWILQWIYPPELKHTPEAPDFAKEKLAEMGALSRAEWIMLFTFGLLLTLWVLGPYLGIDPAVAALAGISILLCTKVLTWEDVLKEQNAWHTFIWLATLLMMSTQLNELGMMQWLGNHLQGTVSTLPWGAALFIVCLLYFYSHYVFASITAHIGALYTAFATVAIASGAPPVLSLLLLAFFSSLCAGITHYGTGTAPVYFGSGYVSFKDWWRVGGIVSIFNILIWSLVGALWWKILGLY